MLIKKKLFFIIYIIYLTISFISFLDVDFVIFVYFGYLLKLIGFSTFGYGVIIDQRDKCKYSTDLSINSFLIILYFTVGLCFIDIIFFDDSTQFMSLPQATFAFVIGFSLLTRLSAHFFGRPKKIK